MPLQNSRDVTRQRILQTYDLVLAIAPLLLPKPHPLGAATGKRVAYLALGGLMAGAAGFALALFLKPDKATERGNSENVQARNEAEDKFDKVADEVEPYAFSPVADDTYKKRSGRQRTL
jgi:Na+/H+-dicarboxylate symporter